MTTAIKLRSDSEFVTASLISEINRGRIQRRRLVNLTIGARRVMSASFSIEAPIRAPTRDQAASAANKGYARKRNETFAISAFCCGSLCGPYIGLCSEPPQPRLAQVWITQGCGFANELKAPFIRARSNSYDQTYKTQLENTAGMQERGSDQSV